MYTDVRIVEEEMEDFDIQILTGPRQETKEEAGESPSPSPEG